MDSKTEGRRGPKAAPRKVCLINMLETGYRDLSRWAEKDDSTKAEALHDMMARERARREAMK